MMSKFQAIQSEIYFFNTVVITGNSFFFVIEFIESFTSFQEKKRE